MKAREGIGFCVQQLNADYRHGQTVTGIRLFRTRAQAERCKNGFGPIAPVCIAEHWGGPLPRGGARFTRSDQSFYQLLAAIMREE